MPWAGIRLNKAGSNTVKKVLSVFRPHEHIRTSGPGAEMAACCKATEKHIIICHIRSPQNRNLQALPGNSYDVTAPVIVQKVGLFNVPLQGNSKFARIQR